MLGDGRDGVEIPAVYKPERGERPLWDFPDGTLAGREVAAYLMSAATGWAAVVALRRGEHMRMTALVDSLQPAARAVLEMLATVVQDVVHARLQMVTYIGPNEANHLRPI